MTPTRQDAVAQRPEPVVFAAPAEPIASVIVLAWRLGAELVDCLRSLQQSDFAGDYEVQLVLNGASATTRAAVAENVRGAHIVDLDANVGYGGGCNAAALRSRGKYLILLNDDTIVDPAWLGTIVAAAEKGPAKLGALSSLLLNTDGTVQEAGSRVRRDAGTVQFGKGQTVEDAAKAGLLTPRQVDYGSGAALLIRREAFEKVSGFDPLYEPAYYEDVDLCFRIRRAGYTVGFLPTARVTHSSGGSTDSDRRFRDFAASRSGRYFTARWSQVLAAAPDADAPVEKICDPTLATTLLPAVPDDIHDPIPSVATALAIAGDYQTWLNQQLDIAQENLLVEQHLRASDKERIEALTESARLATQRLSDLERLGLPGMVRWRVGLLVRRRAARQHFAALKQERAK